MKDIEKHKGERMRKEQEGEKKEKGKKLIKNVVKVRTKG